ncbi:MAG: AAA family ATPase [Calditrichaeota bacterium]|nr:MAG: AAA family ATPase [Calditrichota bacterium]
MLITLSQLTGLPVSILDDRQGLNLEELERFFRQRIFGQPEAIECLVERIAMIKAGLTDPTRPQGVFLFAGPTGTGKTEIAKALAEYLFGSPQRMIRLDMSEFQTPESLDRILGIAGGETTRSKALVNLIRKQPFSVILLDEFEKSAPNIWDLFLQVFDDGRLTDHHGNTADFRHCIIIMTSNLGGVIPTGDSIGFTGREGAFTPGQVGRAIERTFRKEFLNRLDRIVVFHPFSRATMREILLKELNDVLNRRGLRTRSWAVEWHDSAIDFLLEKGFTADLGARPLKRAIERYLLSPLARTIVNHQFPEGDQFLFVRSDGKRIEVEFVDPDAPEFAEEPPSPEKTADTETEALQLPRLVLEATGTLAEVSFLRQEYERLSEHIRGEEWERKKQGALEQTSAEGFWESPGRFTVLGLVEYMDRIEVGLSTAGRLLDRLIGSRPGDRRQFLPRLVQQLAHQLYLIDAACRGLLEGLPQDAFVEIRATHDRSVPPEAVDVFARRLTHMYRRWVEKRRMRLNVLQEQGGDGHTPYHALLAITGYAAYSILRQENGLHVLELPGQGKAFRRGKVHVRVVPQPEQPPGTEPDALYRQCVETLAATRAREEGQLIIVRRYREEPSPLVRDSVRKWRTGRLDRVLDGDFDLVG